MVDPRVVFLGNRRRMVLWDFKSLERNPLESELLVPAKQIGDQRDRMVILGVDHSIREQSCKKGPSVGGVSLELRLPVLDVGTLDLVLPRKRLDEETKASDAKVLIGEMREVVGNG